MSDDLNNPWEALFGKGKIPFDEDFIDSFGHVLQQKDEKADDLQKIFNQGVAQNDRSFLEKVVVDYNDDVSARAKNTNLQVAHARAALYVDNKPICYESLDRITNPSAKHYQAAGLVAYDMGNHEAAIEKLKRVGVNLSMPARIAHSLSLIELGVNYTRIHEKLLALASVKLGLANTILGYVHFINGETEKAEEYLSIAAKMNPSSEDTNLDLIRIQVINGKKQEVYTQINQFYVDTGSELGAEELIKELEERKLKVPKVAMKNLFSIVNQLLGYKN